MTKKKRPTVKDYSWVTQEMFDKTLQEIVECNTAQIMMIPDVYALLADHYNNEVLELLEEEREDERG